MATSSQDTPSTSMSATRARQGRYGRHVLWVLIVSVVLAAAALFGAWFSKSDDLAAANVNAGQEPADAQAFDASAPAKQNEVERVPGAPGATQADR